MKTKQYLLIGFISVLCIYSVGILTRTIGFTIISNTSGQSPIGGNATVVNYCLISLTTQQAGTDYSDYRDVLDFGSFFAAGAMGTPRRVVLSANQSGNRQIDIDINGTEWKCESGTCLGGEGSTGQNCSMAVGVTHYINTSSVHDNSTEIDESTEYDSANVLQPTSNQQRLFTNLNSTGQWTNMSVWFNVKAPDNTSAGTYKQNVTFEWDCS